MCICLCLPETAEPVPPKSTWVHLLQLHLDVQLRQNLTLVMASRSVSPFFPMIFERYFLFLVLVPWSSAAHTTG